jgi:hypothetical protein
VLGSHLLLLDVEHFQGVSTPEVGWTRLGPMRAGCLQIRFDHLWRVKPLYSCQYNIISGHGIIPHSCPVAVARLLEMNGKAANNLLYYLLKGKDSSEAIRPGPTG